MTRCERQARTERIEKFVKQNGGISIGDLARHFKITKSVMINALRKAYNVYEGDCGGLYFHDWTKSV